MINLFDIWEYVLINNGENRQLGSKFDGEKVAIFSLLFC